MLEALLELLGLVESGTEPEDPGKRRRGRLIRLAGLALILAAATAPAWLPNLVA